MPHCIIEYSDNLVNKKQIQEIVKVVHSTMENCGLFDKRTIKTRAISISTYIVGSDEQSFIHVTVKMLAGRTNIQKDALNKSILEKLMAQCDIGNISIEALDLSDSYDKK